MIEPRRQVRKNSLYASRLTSLGMAGMSHHYALMGRLSVDNMSGDETDEGAGEQGPKTYRIIKSKWQSAAFKTFLRALDAVHLDLWLNPPRPGLWWTSPRVRFETADPAVDVPPPTGLWRNCYDQDWLRSLSPEQRDALEIVDEDYNFDLTALNPAATTLTALTAPLAPIAPASTEGEA